MTPNDQWEADRNFHNCFFSTDDTSSSGRANNVHLEEIRTTPLFSADVLANVLERSEALGAGTDEVLPQYGLLAKTLETFNSKEDEDTNEGVITGQPEVAEIAVQAAVNESLATPEPEDNRLFVNTHAPWSAFICGSQGSGKSHTLSCMLEAALHQPGLGKLPKPLSGMVFHYDKFTGVSNGQICEAAYLSSGGIPVKVLVSPSNYYRLSIAYNRLPGLRECATKPMVAPLVLFEQQLNIQRMMRLMAADDRDGQMPLYMQSVCSILRTMAIDEKEKQGIDFAGFEARLLSATPNENQKAMLNARIQLLRNFFHKERSSDGAPNPMNDSESAAKKKAARQQVQDQMRVDEQMEKIANKNIWEFKAGELTIIDLSDPFIDESAACVLFDICLALFLEDRKDIGRIVALDEAHKFMTATSSSTQLTESLLSVIRQQRHLATRVIIATQEPTISPALLDLSSMTIVHRFTSPSWLAALKSHLAGISVEGETSKRDIAEVFKNIVKLEAGQALLFSPSAMTGGHVDGLWMQKLGVAYLRIGVRGRLTADGGRSIMATSLAG